MHNRCTLSENSGKKTKKNRKTQKKIEAASLFVDSVMYWLCHGII